MEWDIVAIFSMPLGFHLWIFPQTSTQTAAASLLLQPEMQPQLLMLGVGLVLELQLTCSNCTSSQLLWSKSGQNIFHKRFREAPCAMKIPNSHLPSVTPLKKVLYCMIISFRFLKGDDDFWKSYLSSTHCINSNIEIPVLTQNVIFRNIALIAIVATRQRFCGRTFVNNHEC